MSFQIMLQRNNSNPNFVDKDVEDIAQATGVWKRGTSIINPVFTIDTVLTEDMISHVNYVYCEALGRYYYVTNIIAESPRLWTFHCHVDVLMSYKDKIREQTAIVARQAAKFNMYLDDGWFMAYQDPIIQTKLFSAASPFEHQEFVLVVAGS